jgi:hypothetical protein
VFAVRVSPGGPTAAPDAPPASDNAPATPNTVTAFVRPFRFEFRLPCEMVGAFPFHPHLNVSLYANDSPQRSVRTLDRHLPRRGSSNVRFGVKSRRSTSAQYPLYPQKRTWFSTIVMSALCRKQTHALQQTACRLMKWSGRAPAPPAIKVGQAPSRGDMCLEKARDHQFIISCSQFGRDSKF